MITSIKKENDRIQATVSGRFTTDEAAGFLKKIEPLTGEDFTELTIDLSGLEFISSAGLRCMVMLLKTCEAKNAELRLKNMTSQIKDIFNLTALTDKFNIE